MNKAPHFVFFAVVALSLASPQRALLAEDVAQTIATAMPGTAITSTAPTVIDGLFEVIAGDNVLYVDSTGRYLVIGSIYDLLEDKDLSAARRAEITHASTTLNEDPRTTPIDVIPMDTAITVGEGRRSLTVITDPDCGWCRRLWIETLSDLDGVRVQHLLLNHSPKALGILCADDPGEALGRAFKVSATTMKTPIPSARCRSEAAKKIARVARFANSVGLIGTPVLIRDDGVIHAGYLGREALLDWLGGKPDES